jgi:xylan 1,4-beta-xylosidase
MRRLSLALLLLTACAAPATLRRDPAPVARNTTFANPLDIEYRFMPEAPSRRETADPMITLFGDDYFLFASKSGGYWHSPDLRQWTHVVPEGYPLEEYAPAVVTIGGRMYYTAHKAKAIYTTDDPKAGRWRKIADIDAYADPAFFVDDDERLYLYFGSGLNGGISGVELDPRNDFKVVAGPVELMQANHADHGWERSGPDNLGARMTEGFRIAPYVEGSWMTKHDGTYYLQYSAPGTVWNSYADGVYTSRSPLGGFTYAPYSPFSYKPGGFIGSAGHAGTFRDKAGDYWRVVTMVVSVLHKFERRLGIFPAGFDADGVMRTDTYLGDYPQFLPGIVASPLGHNRTGWMLLSGGKRATASSSLPDHATPLAFDEDVRTWWSARTGDAGEWLAVDLGAPARVEAIQINFAEQDTKLPAATTGPYQRYVVERSDDGVHWSTVLDRGGERRDASHPYVQLDEPVTARHVRVTNVHTAAGGRFAIRDLRVFGESTVELPAAIAKLTVRRHDDERSVTLSWERVPRAQGYVVRYGLAPDKLYANYQVGDTASVTLNSLNRGVTYWFTVDAIGEGGVARGTVLERAGTGGSGAR